MLYRLAIAGIALVCALCPVAELAAQSQRPLSAEASLGFRTGHGGSYDGYGGAALDVAVVYRLRDAPAGTWRGGVAAGLQSAAGSRHLDCRLLPNGGCAPDLPPLVWLAALGGVQRGTVRLLAGPTYHESLSVRVPGGGIGLQGRLDLAVPPQSATTAVLSLRHSLLPRFRGETVGITSLGVGVRVR